MPQCWILSSHRMPSKPWNGVALGGHRLRRRPWHPPPRPPRSDLISKPLFHLNHSYMNRMRGVFLSKTSLKQIWLPWTSRIGGHWRPAKGTVVETCGWSIDTTMPPSWRLCPRRMNISYRGEHDWVTEWVNGWVACCGCMWLYWYDDLSPVSAPLPVLHCHVLFCLRYVPRPLLWHQKKFHFRCYSLLRADMSAYLYEKGFIICAGLPYILCLSGVAWSQ